MIDEVTAVVLLREDGAALLQHRDDKPGLRHAGCWGFPGGHRDPGERLDACARRELLEETEYRCRRLNRLETGDHADGPKTTYRLTVYWARYDGVQKVRCLEGQGLEFIRREDAHEYKVPPYVMAAWGRALARARGRAPQKTGERKNGN
ncbi:MAG: NUDIX domain-containing protein [Elusimicrobia bacterium]|nr:NUDIX domain-containing protein [Elusimicrobiota bacterium]